MIKLINEAGTRKFRHGWVEQAKERKLTTNNEGSLIRCWDDIVDLLKNPYTTVDRLEIMYEVVYGNTSKPKRKDALCKKVTMALVQELNIKFVEQSNCYRLVESIVCDRAYHTARKPLQLQEPGKVTLVERPDHYAVSLWGKKTVDAQYFGYQNVRGWPILSKRCPVAREAYAKVTSEKGKHGLLERFAGAAIMWNQENDVPKNKETTSVSEEGNIACDTCTDMIPNLHNDVQEFMSANNSLEGNDHLVSESSEATEHKVSPTKDVMKCTWECLLTLSIEKKICSFV